MGLEGIVSKRLSAPYPSGPSRDWLCVVVDDCVNHFSRGDLGLDRIEEADELLVPMALHVAADDGHPKVRQWLARHPRWTFHFTPTSASWGSTLSKGFSPSSQQLAFWPAHHDERGFASMHICHVASGTPVAAILRPARTPRAPR